MDKLADGLQKLNEDDLLQVVQMVHDNKTPDSYTKNDVESMCPRSFIPPLSLLTKSLDANNSTKSGRIPRRPVHPPGYFDQDAVGLYSRARCSLSRTRKTLTTISNLVPISVLMLVSVPSLSFSCNFFPLLEPWELVALKGIGWVFSVTLFILPFRRRF